MACIDSRFIASIEVDLSTALEPVEIDDGAPFLDIEVVRSPYIDTDATVEPHTQAGCEAASDAFEKRVGALREPFPGDCHLLVSYGEALYASAGSDPAVALDSATWSVILDETVERFPEGRWLSVADRSCHSSEREPTDRRSTQAGDVGMLLRVHSGEQDRALVAVIGLDPSVPDVDRGGEDCSVSRLVSLLGTRAGLVTPVYLICVTPRDVLLGDAATRSFTRFLRRMRPSLVLHAGVATSELVQLTASDLREEHPRSEPLSLVSCPTFKAGEGTPGIARLRLDLEGHTVNLAFRHDLGPDRPIRTTQALQPLRSVSRVSGTEHELHRIAQELLRQRTQEAIDDRVADTIAEFERIMEATWTADGYVALCDKSGRFPEIRHERDSKYKLLVLLRRQPDGEDYDILLSNHTPLARPAVARWDTLLLPAFTKTKALLERLRDDVVRQAAAETEDLERSERARIFVRTVANILRGNSDWSDETLDLAQFTTRKLSPTDARITEYDYTFVTIPSLLHQPTTQETERSQDGAKIIQWLGGLPAVRSDEACGLPLEALERGGAGVRWDPESCLAEPDGWRQGRRAQAFPPGVVWFPLQDRLWRNCPSIVARNADVMKRLEEQLSVLRGGGGRLPPEFLLAADS